MRVERVYFTGTPNGQYLGYATLDVVSDGFKFTMRGFRLLRGVNGHEYNVAMPSREKPGRDGRKYFEDIVNPGNPETRDMLEREIVKAYLSRK